MREINLLPKTRQQEFHNELILRSLLVAIWISAVGFALALAIQLGEKFYLQSQLFVNQTRIDQLKTQVDKKENAEIKQEIQGVNNIISDYKNLAAGIPKWSKVIEAFAVLPPEGVKISSFSIDTARKSVTISGISQSRELVILLYNNIKNDPQHFYNIDFPLENIVKAANSEFHFTFFIKDELIK